MQKEKFMFSEWFKCYEIIQCTTEVYNNSPEIEQNGTFTAIKIKDKTHKNFLITEAKNKGFIED